MHTTVLNEILALLFGRRYYVNVVARPATSEMSLMGQRFALRSDVRRQRRQIENSLAYVYVTTISYRKPGGVFPVLLRKAAAGARRLSASLARFGNSRGDRTARLALRLSAMFPSFMAWRDGFLTRRHGPVYYAVEADTPSGGDIGLMADIYSSLEETEVARGQLERGKDSYRFAGVVSFRSRHISL